MAGRKLKERLTVRASTILEVVISMVVILIVFTIAMMIYANVNRLSLSAKKVKAESLLKERLLLIEQSGPTENQAQTVEEFVVEQSFGAYQDNKHLTEVHLTAFDLNHEKVAELQKVIINP